MMRRQISRGRFLCALTFGLALCPSAGAAGDGVVVLRSGGVLHGKVSTVGERYEVTRPNSVVEVPATQVLLVADSMRDAYEQQRRQLPRETAEAHLGLAEWCLRYDLVEPAARELADARRLDPRDPRVALLERRLAVARLAKPQEVEPPASAVREDASANEELKELEEAVADLPPGTVERFARKVQPLLVNGCTTSGCHRPAGEQAFQLDRAVLHGLSNRRITLRNLVATLELVNRDAPQQSELLSIPRDKHGGRKGPVFGPRQESQFVQLVDWVGMVTETGVAAEPIATISNRTAKPQAFVDRRVVAASAEVPSLLPQPAIQFGADLKPWAPKDEFDPEIFNRQQHQSDGPPPAVSIRDSAANGL